MCFCRFVSFLICCCATGDLLQTVAKTAKNPRELHYIGSVLGAFFKIRQLAISIHSARVFARLKVGAMFTELSGFCWRRIRKSRKKSQGFFIAKKTGR